MVFKKVLQREVSRIVMQIGIIVSWNMSELTGLVGTDKSQGFPEITETVKELCAVC